MILKRPQALNGPSVTASSHSLIVSPERTNPRDDIVKELHCYKNALNVANKGSW